MEKGEGGGSLAGCSLLSVCADTFFLSQSGGLFSLESMKFAIARPLAIGVLSGLQFFIFFICKKREWWGGREREKQTDMQTD